MEELNYRAFNKPKILAEEKLYFNEKIGSTSPGTECGVRSSNKLNLAKTKIVQANCNDIFVRVN